MFVPERMVLAAPGYGNTSRKSICASRLFVPQISLSAFAYLFSEMIQYNKDRVDSIAELENRLAECGR